MKSIRESEEEEEEEQVSVSLILRVFFGNVATL